MAIDETERLVGVKYFRDAVTFATIPSVPALSFGDREIKSGDPLKGDKARMRVRASYSQGNVAAATETRGLLIVHGTTATAVAFYVSNSARATGDSTVTVNLRKNGVTILTAVVTLSVTVPSAGSGFASTLATLDPALVSAVKGDVFDVVITATVGSGTLPTEVMCTLVADEDPA